MAIVASFYVGFICRIVGKIGKFMRRTFTERVTSIGEKNLVETVQRIVKDDHVKCHRLNSRYDIIHRSESMAPEDRQQFVDKVWSPLETIAKHLAVEQSKFMDQDNERSNLAATRYQETFLDNKDEVKRLQKTNDFSRLSENENSEGTITVPPNHKSSIEEDYASTEKYEFEAQKIVGTTTESELNDCNTTVISKETKINKTETIDNSKDIDTIEGFKQFNDSVS